MRILGWRVRPFPTFVCFLLLICVYANYRFLPTKPAPSSQGQETKDNPLFLEEIKPPVARTGGSLRVGEGRTKKDNDDPPRIQRSTDPPPPPVEEERVRKEEEKEEDKPALHTNERKDEDKEKPKLVARALIESCSG